MCHPDVRAAICRYLMKIKTRKQLDQPHDTEEALFEKVLEVYMREDLQWERPDVMDTVDPEGKICDPEKAHMFPCPNANWIKETWIYLREKYRVVSKCWVKQTGGGGRELYDFPNYCTIKG